MDDSSPYAGPLVFGDFLLRVTHLAMEFFARGRAVAASDRHGIRRLASRLKFAVHKIFKKQFNAQLDSSIEQIYQASVHKQPASP